MEEKHRHTIKKIFSLLDCFSAEHSELGVREAARMLNLSSSSVGRLLSDLRDAGVLTQNPDTRLYALGGRVMRWAGTYIGSSDLRRAALPYMKAMLEATNETVSLYVREENERVCVERFESRQNVRIVEMVGQRIHLYTGSGGKAMMAYLDDHEIEQVLAAILPDSLGIGSPLSIAELRTQFREIRQIGYAISHGEWVREASGVGAPIFNEHGVAVGSISISGPSQRFQDPQKIADYVKVLLTGTKTISGLLGCSV